MFRIDAFKVFLLVILDILPYYYMATIVRAL